MLYEGTNEETLPRVSLQFRNLEEKLLSENRGWTITVIESRLLVSKEFSRTALNLSMIDIQGRVD